MPNLQWWPYWLVFATVVWSAYRSGQYLIARFLSSTFPYKDKFFPFPEEGPFRASAGPLLKVPTPRWVEWCTRVLDGWNLRKSRVVGWFLVSGVFFGFVWAIEVSSKMYDAEVEVVSRNVACIMRTRGNSDILWRSYGFGSDPPVCPRVEPPAGMRMREPEFTFSTQFVVRSAAWWEAVNKFDLWTCTGLCTATASGPDWFTLHFHDFVVGSRWKTKVDRRGHLSYDFADWELIEAESSLPPIPPSTLSDWDAWFVAASL